MQTAVTQIVCMAAKQRWAAYESKAKDTAGSKQQAVLVRAHTHVDVMHTPSSQGVGAVVMKN